MIAATAAAPLARPHLLLLTGDQIYADDVADGLLAELTLTGNMLLGWSSDHDYADFRVIESMPIIDPDGYGNDLTTRSPAELRPGRRAWVLHRYSGLTADVPGKPEYSKSHLLSFAEYAAMYLFAWSNEVWPNALPTFAQVNDDIVRTYDALGKPAMYKAHKKSYDTELSYVVLFRDTVSQARRALANVPTYMMFDDHEVTDDWYFNLAWCQGDVSSRGVLTNPLGRRVLQNGLLAYAVFQGWGNRPDDYEAGTAGALLLDRAATWVAGKGSVPADLASLLGIPQVPDMAAANPLQLRASSLNMTASQRRAQGPLDWHFTVRGPSDRFTILALDSRTWRGFPGSRVDPCLLISPQGLAAQFEAALPPADDGVLIVIAPGPVVGAPFPESRQKAASSQEARLDLDVENWKIQPVAFEGLLANIVSLGPSSGGPRRKIRALLLSGDVHYAFTARLRYWARRPYQGAANLPTDAAIAQLTASSFRNETTSPRLRNTHMQHEVGFLVTQDGLPDPERWLGWNDPPTGKDVVMTRLVPVALSGGGATVMIERERIRVRPAVVLLNDYAGVDPASPPIDWQYRVEYVLGDNDAGRVAPPLAVPYPPPGNRDAELQAYLGTASSAKGYMGQWGDGKETVGLNNLGEITFRWNAAEDKSVIHELWWRLEGQPTAFPLTRCVVSLSLGDAEPAIPGLP
jgi:hypothetical protein